MIKYFMGLLVLIFIFASLQGLLMPKYTRMSYEGAMVREYYGEHKDHDILFIGDCEVYANISPVILWDEFGFTSYIRGSAQQLVWHSYYLLEDALNYEKPKLVVFNVMAMQYGEPQSEAYNRLTLDDMRLSLTKIKAVNTSRMAHENPLSYIFPLLRYHDRWSELNTDDVKYFFTKPPYTLNGFQIQSEIKPVGAFVPSGNPLPNYSFSAKTYKYLDKITKLCNDNEIPLMLIKAPVLYPWWYPEWDRQMEDYAKENNLIYINLLNHIDEIGLDFSTDTFNAGLHLNVYGAEKLAVYLGEIIKNEFQLPDRRDEPETAVRWEEKRSIYNRVIERQQNEIREYGSIQTFLIE